MRAHQVRAPAEEVWLGELVDDPVALEQAIASRHESDVAEALNALAPAEAAHVLTALSVERGGRVLGSSTLRRPERIVPFLSAEFLAPRIETLDGDVRGALMRALPAHDRDRLTRRLSPRTLAQVGRALASPPHAVGAVASDDFVALPLRTTVADCRRALALGSRRARERGVVIVDDESGAYRGVVTTAQLLDAPDATPVGRLLGETTTLAVAASAALGTVADVAVRRDADLLAVLGDDRRPVGVVTTRILLRHLVRHPTTSFDARLLLGGFVLVTALVIVLLLGYLTRLHR